MKKILERLFQHGELSRGEAELLMTEIAEGKYNEVQLASLLTVYRMRPISMEELAGFRKALLDLMIKVPYDTDTIIDMCGTGGDGKDTFNISTLASIIVAGAGYKVAKHGNSAVSSVCGSSNVMESLGYKFTNDASIIQSQLDRFNLSFMHAPLFHPALKPLGPVRKGLGVKTFFNMMGPLVNPARPHFQVTGVYSLELIPFYKFIMEEDQMQFNIIHSLDGYDEISLTGATKMVTENGDQILEPEDFGHSRLNPEAIAGAHDIKSATDLFKNILEGKGTPAQQSVVLTNAAIGIQCMNRSKSFEECYQEAEVSLSSGKAKTNLQGLLHSINF